MNSIIVRASVAGTAARSGDGNNSIASVGVPLNDNIFAVGSQVDRVSIRRREDNMVPDRSAA